MAALIAVYALVAGPVQADPSPSTRSVTLTAPVLSGILRRCEAGPDARARLARFRAEMLAAVNVQRASHGLASLTAHRTLDHTAQVHAEDMAAHGFMSHQGTDGSDVAQRASRSGYFYVLVAENVARGQASVTEVVQDWMGSPGHRANILLADAAHLGVGFAVGAHEGSDASGWLPGCFWAMVAGAEFEERD